MNNLTGYALCATNNIKVPPQRIGYVAMTAIYGHTTLAPHTAVLGHISAITAKKFNYFDCSRKKLRD